MEDVRQIHVGAAPHEARLHHADDGAHFTIQHELSSQHSGIAAKLPLPEFVTENGYRLCAGDGVGGQGRAAKQGRNTHHSECVHGAVIAAQALRVSAAGPDHVGPCGRDDALEYRIALRNFEKLVNGVVAAVRPLAGILNPHAHQAVDIFVGERIEDNGVDHAVHGRAPADAEHERGKRNGGKSAALGRITDAEANVAQKLSEPIHV